MNIEFATEEFLSGSSVICPQCGKETPIFVSPEAKPASDPQPQAEILQVIKQPDYYLAKELQLGDANYILYLAPGDVRHLQVRNFIKYKADDWIAYFKQISLTPKISGPYGRESEGLEAVIPEGFFPEITWEDKFRILHSFAVLYRDYGVPSAVYEYFHKLMKLQSLEFAECINSWVKEAWNNYFIAQSYAESDQYLIMQRGDVTTDPETVCFAVFKKTPFVIQRFEELRKVEETENTAENLERLRRSSFTVFVYLMEDLRNGLFKIGQSQTPEKREKTLQSEVPETSLRFYMPAHDAAEQELHEMFSGKRVRGEWFELTPRDILSVIEFLKQKGDLSRASADFDWLGKITLGV
ncbi:MAG TPA: GIY-YIG nuclease family protein [Methylomirabilota bacterium]|nr:GIY-YIG nuclease family protein [Methylomirabilota bacterium]